MAKKGSSSTNPKRIAQRARTNKNKEKKYKKLLAEKPNSKDAKIWQKKLDSLK